MANTNTALQNALADAFAARFPQGSILEIRSGSKPASANTAASGTLGASITLHASPWAAASAGVVAKNGTWEATATATITAGWARLRNAADWAFGGRRTMPAVSGR